VTREEPVSEPKSNGKPFAISKRLVWEAWRRVKANDGAEGVDEESIQAFEANLKANLYKVWNRMSSGSYMPPPVRAVEIPKKSGRGVRTLGVPTVISYCCVIQRAFGFVGGYASVSSAVRAAGRGSVCAS
jgi:retron-type reverse transcriptase